MGNLPWHWMDDSLFIENHLHGEFANALQQTINLHVKSHLNIKKEITRSI